jgi:DNA polymerase type B, organellar and viral
MLPNKLSELAKVFQGEYKSIFPYYFVNNNLNYIGNVPDFKYFTNISKAEYKLYLNSFNGNNWNLNNEIIKYCMQDCINLYQIISKFNELIFDLSSLNIHNYTILLSLTFDNYRVKHLNDYKIPLITGQPFLEIRKSYTGGSTNFLYLLV